MFVGEGFFFWFIQLLGLSAILIQNLAIFLPCGKRIMKFQSVSCAMWAAHYGLRGLDNVMYMCMGGFFINIVSSRTSTSQLIRYNLAYTFVIVIVLFTIMDHTSDMVPVLLSILACWRAVSRDNLVYMHSLGLISAIIWTSYHFYCGSWFGVMNDSIVTVTTLLALLKVLFPNGFSVRPAYAAVRTG